MMPRSSVLIDSSFLYALTDRQDKYHETAKAFAIRHQNQLVHIIPDIVLTEVTHAINRLISHYAVIIFLKNFAVSDAQLQAITMVDIKRAHEIMEKYADAKLDFVDCCIMALSERLNITQICTFDRRDFPIFRPTHCEHLELLP